MSGGQDTGQFDASRGADERSEAPAAKPPSGKRYLRPSVAVFTLALLASVCVHLPIYEALGALADVMARAPATLKQQFVELELAPLGEDEVLAKQDERIEPTDPKHAEPEPPAPLPEPPDPPEVAEQEQPKLLPQPEAQPEPKPIEVVYQEAPTKHAIDQKSDNPEAPPPPDARFVSEENRSVLEETVASARNMQRDDTPQSGSGPPSTFIGKV